ncbi:transglycosylase domain-containing protein [Comamonas composti]|uniref:transglycosylase domain-containing protein n=1 Tax=Comamonas composti TaxID=408558 RepID=UPI00068421CB|nr:transglycosylase domain-containing protein [Comamonas composti]
MSRLSALWAGLRASALGQRIAVLPWWHRWPTWREWLMLAAALPLLFTLYVLCLIPFTPGIRDIRKEKQEIPARILSADGKELAQFRRSNREWVGLAQISPNVIKALIATEDHRFYSHHGMDFTRTVGSVIHTLGGRPQGGSTLTQQLARNLYPEEIGRAPTLNRKLKEAITAFKIEALYTKDEILETYLNTVPFLYNAYGIEMAARTYFDKSAARLSVLEGATLVGMLKGTSYYNPVLNPGRALDRRNTVLSQMAKRGELSREEFAQLRKRPMRLNFERQEEPQGMAPHFAQQLRKWLIAWADSNDYNIHTDGLVVHTTLDSRLQSWANQAVARQTRQLQGIANSAWSQRDGWSAGNPLVQQLLRETPDWQQLRAKGESEEAALKTLLADKRLMARLREDKTRVQAGFVALDTRSSHILAWVGSSDFARDAYDHVQQARRQPGSTFKPFVYGAALQQGMQPGDMRIDQAVEIHLPGGEIWSPTDAGPPTGQDMTLADALAYSKNTITAALMQQVGPQRVARLARALGVRQSPLQEVPALALGSSPVSLLEMVNAYASLARGGQYLAPLMVTRIEDREGRLLAEFQSRPERALDEALSYELVDMLRGVVDKGTGVAIRSRHGIRADVAGKTGTTQGNADGWFILMHPDIVAGAWAGFNDARITLRSDRWGQGSRSALPMVGNFMARALQSPLADAKARFEPPRQESWWGDLTDRLRQRVQDWWGSDMPTAPDQPARPAPESAPDLEPATDPGPALSPGEEIIESTPALPPSVIPEPVAAETASEEALQPEPSAAAPGPQPVPQPAPDFGAQDAPLGEGVQVMPVR